MKRHIKYIGILFEDVLRAVAVVDVPVDDCHAIEPVLTPSGSGGDSRAIEKAEAEGLVRLCVMARRAHERKSATHLTTHHAANSCQHAANSCARSALCILVIVYGTVALWLAQSPLIRFLAHRARSCRHVLHMLRCVHGEQLRIGR